MNEDTGVHYVGPWQIGETLSGFGGVGVVMASKRLDYIVGDLIQGTMSWPWVLYFVLNMDEQAGIFAKVQLTPFDGRIAPNTCLLTERETERDFSHKSVYNAGLLVSATPL